MLHLPHNHGRALARNAGIARARTEAVLSLDADDALEPGHLAATVPALLADPTTGIVYTDYRLFGQRSGVMRAEPYIERNLYRRQYIFAGSLFRRSLFARTRGYCDEFRIGNEDWDLWLTLVEAGAHAAWVAAPLYRYRLHAQSWSSAAAGSDDADFRSRILLLDHHRAAFDRHGATRAFLAETYRRQAGALQRGGDLERARAAWRQVVRHAPWDLWARCKA